MAETQEVITKEEFTDKVVREYKSSPEGSYIEATTIVCERLGLDMEDIKVYASEVLLDYIMEEAKAKNLLKIKQTTVSLF